MRVLFFVDRPGVLRQFASLVTELAARGHDVHLALRSEPDEDQQPQVERLVGASPHITSGPAPARDQRDGWRPVAWAVRALGDLARYAQPRYADAPTLRARVTGKVVRRFERATELEPVGRRLGQFQEGVVMTRFFSHLSLAENGDGRLAPFAEELPEPVAGEPAP